MPYCIVYSHFSYSYVWEYEVVGPALIFINFTVARDSTYMYPVDSYVSMWYACIANYLKLQMKLYIKLFV